LLYVIAAGVRSNKRYSNPVAYPGTEFWLFMFLYLYCIIACDVVKICYVVVNMKFLFVIENTL